MRVILHTNTDHHYIIDDVIEFDVLSAAIEAKQIPQEEEESGFRFREVEE